MTISLGVIVLGFSGMQKAVTRAFGLAASQIGKSIHFTHPHSVLLTNNRSQLEPLTFATQTKIQQSIKTQLPRQAVIAADTQRQEHGSVPVKPNFQAIQSKANGCPKNLDYFTQKPRPKQVPEECITCKNLITCVCQTGN
jgi:hypothetical protein